MEKQKKIPVLRFPEYKEEWKEKKIGNIADKVNSGKTPLGGESAYVESGVLFIRSQNVLDSVLSFENSTYITEATNNTMKNSVVMANDILLNITGASLGRSCVVPKDFVIGNVNQHVCIIRLNKENEPAFVQPIFASQKGQNIFTSLQTGSGREGLNFQSIKGISLSFPSLQEQTKIANFLTLVDKKLQTLKQKKTLLEEYKKGIMQQIYSQKIRFKDDNGNDFDDWEEKNLGEIITEYNEKSIINDQYVVLSSSMNGIKLQSDYFNKDVSSKDNTGYKIVPNGYFTYRSMSDTGSFTFNIQNIVEIGMVSPAYPVFKPKKNIESHFLAYYLNNSSKIINDILSLKEGGTRYALSFNKFSKLEIEIPCLAEQTKIANFIKAIDTKINHCQSQIEKTEIWKKGLLQQMFI